MTIPRFLIALLLGTTSAVSLAAQQPDDLLATPIRAGAVLPPLRLPTIDGDRTIDLADYSGRRVLLIQFASW